MSSFFGATQERCGSSLICFGTYDGGILGYKLSEEACDPIENKQGHKILLRVFAQSAHTGSVKAVGNSQTLFLSAGVDELVRIYDVQRFYGRGLLELGFGGSPCAMSMIDNDFFLVMNESGYMQLFRISDGALLKSMNANNTEKAHKTQNKEICTKNRALTCTANVTVAVHPTGKLCICVNKKNELVLFNLMTCTAAAAENLMEPSLGLSWSPCGGFYVLLFKHRVQVLQPEAPEFRAEFKAEKHPISYTCAAFSAQGHLMVGCSDGSIVVLKLRTETVSLGFLGVMSGGHKSRIKGLSIVKEESDKKGLTRMLAVTFESTGLVCVWRVTIPSGIENGATIEHLESTDSKCRLICMCCSREDGNIEAKGSAIPRNKNKNKIKQSKNHTAETVLIPEEGKLGQGTGSRSLTGKLNQFGTQNRNPNNRETAKHARNVESRRAKAVGGKKKNNTVKVGKPNAIIKKAKTV